MKGRAIKSVKIKNKELEEKKKEFGFDKEIKKIKRFSLQNFISLGEKNIKKLDDLANLSSDELIEIVGENFKKIDADKVIMNARKHWFDEEDKNLKKNIRKNLKK